MSGFLLRRFRDLVIVLAIVCTVMFVILHLVPGSPAWAILGPEATPEQVAALEAQLGLDKSLWEQYLRWLGNALQGDLGYSITQNGGVTHAIVSHFGPTLLVALAVTVLSVAISVPLAVHSINRPDSLLSRMLLAGASLGLAIPSFWLALMLVFVFAVRLEWFPIGGYVSPFDDVVGSLRYLALPVIALVAHQIALLVMTLRESLASELSQAYIRTASAKGLADRAVLYRHLLPNALLPVLTVVGSSFGALLGGIVIIETIFLIPGIGLTLYNGITGRDYNLVLGITLVTALAFVLVNLLVDILYGFLDPRVRIR